MNTFVKKPSIIREIFSVMKSQSKYHSETKSMKYHNSPSKNSIEEMQIKRLMLSEGYNNVFNKLMNTHNLKDFVKQSCQFVQFQQQQIKNLIPPRQSQKYRFSFSLRNTTCSYLAKDYRFLKHYFELLAQNFPEKINKLKNEIYEEYKQSVIDKPRFNSYFCQDSEDKFVNKSALKSIKSQKSINSKKLIEESMSKRNQISIKSQTLGRSLEKQTSQKFVQKYPSNIKTNKNKKVNIESNKKKQYSLKKLQSQKIQSKSIRLNHLIGDHQVKKSQNILSLTKKSKRRTTMQNILLIEQTINEIEGICGKQNKNSNLQNKNTLIKSSKKKQKYSKQKEQFQQNQQRNNNQSENKQKIEQSQITKSEKISIQNQLNQQQIQNKENRFFQKLRAGRSNNKSKKKLADILDQNLQQPTLSKKTKVTTKKSGKKRVTFQQVFDMTDPKNIELLRTIQKLNEQIKSKKKDKIPNQKFHDQMKRTTKKIQFKLKRPFNNEQRNLLTSEQQKIVSQFDQISLIGNIDQFQVDRKWFDYKQFGIINGYILQQVLIQPKDQELRRQFKQLYKALYMKRINAETTEYTKDKEKTIEELRKNLIQNQIEGITLLLIQK